MKKDPKKETKAKNKKSGAPEMELLDCLVLESLYRHESKGVHIK